MISLTCTCGKSYTFKEKFLGQKFRCSQCGTEQTVVEQPEVLSIPEPVMPTELALNPEKAASLKAPPLKLQPASQEPAPLTPNYGDVVASPKPGSYSFAPMEEEYVLISDSAPEFLKEVAMQTPEESSPPSEALSVILGRAAVAEHLKHLEDTLGIRATPVPIPVNIPKRQKKHAPTEPEQEAALRQPEQSEQPEHPVLHHASEKNPFQLVIILFIIIAVLVLIILALLVFQLGGGGGKEHSSQRHEKSDRVTSIK